MPKGVAAKPATKESGVIRENFVLVFQVVTKGQNDFPHCFHATAFAVFNPVNGQGRNARLAGQFSLAHQKLFPDSLQRVTCQFHYLVVCKLRTTIVSGLEPPPPGSSKTPLNALKAKLKSA